MTRLKAAFITDVHIGPSGYFQGVRRKLTEYSEEYIANFVEEVSQSSEYSFAIQLGDLIQDDIREIDVENYKNGIELFAPCTIPFHHLVGNHDTVHLSPEEVATLLGYDSLYYSFDIRGVHIVLMYSQVLIPKVPGIVVPEEQLAWLKQDLSSTSLPTMVFVHHSFADQDLTGNPWFEGRPEDCLVENRVEVREVFASSRKVVAVINGHLHWNQVTIHDDIPYITVQSATENFADDGVPANSWGEIELSGAKFKLEVFGNDPLVFTHQIKP